MEPEVEVPPRLIAGSARSGTTWVQDVLAQTNAMRPIFEPLHPYTVATRFADPGFAHRYIAPADDVPDLRAFMDAVFSGEIRSLWSDYRIRPQVLVPHMSMVLSQGEIFGWMLQWKFAAQRYVRFRKMLKYSPVLVKIIRGNLMLGWLRRYYAARIVFVVRHPGAVVESKLRLGGQSWDPEPVLELFRRRDVLGVVGDGYASLLASRLEPEEAHTLIWCIENQLPLACAAADGYPVIFYENLLSDGERQWRRIVDALELSNSPYGDEILKKPSQQADLTRKKKLAGAGESWMDRLSPQHKEGVQRILDETGVTEYCISESRPLAVYEED